MKNFKLPKFKVVNSLSEVPLQLDVPTFSDVETDGLYINTRLLQVFQSHMDTIYIIDTDIIPLKEIKTWLKPFWTIWWNASYDFGTLNMTTEKFDDLMYLTKIAYPEFQKYNLDLCISRFDYDGLYDGLDKKKLQKMGFVKGAYLSQNQLRYAATDVYALSLIWEDKKIQYYRDNLAYKVDIMSMKYAIQYQQNGLLVDLEKRAEMVGKVQVKIGQLTGQLPMGLNVNSYVQVRKYLNVEKSDYDALIKLGGSGLPMADKALVVLDLRQAKKQLSYLESINHKKMVTRFNVYGASTGRMSASGGDIPNGFNSQQIPRAFQSLFKHDTEDTTVVGLDYSTLELRLAAAIYNEPTMYKELMDGKDLHTEMARHVTGKELSPDGLLGTEADTIKTTGRNVSKYLTSNDRTLAKAVNFGFVFGMSAATYMNYAYVSYGIRTSMEEAIRIRNLYFQKYQGMKAYHAKVWKNYKKPTFIYTTALGRRVKPNLGTDAINGPVQGSGGETTKLAVHYLIKEHPEAINYIINVVHDAIYLRVPKEDEALWRYRLETAMMKGWQEIMKSDLFHYHDIPMIVAA